MGLLGAAEAAAVAVGLAAFAAVGAGREGLGVLAGAMAALVEMAGATLGWVVLVAERRVARVGAEKVGQEGWWVD